jgi:TRAP-type C4-dicarboxylate transport system substrate-binding protein
MFNVYDRTATGAADLGTGVQGSIGGKFPGSSVVELPSDIAGKEGAASFWKIYQDGLIAPEYSGVRPLALFVYPQSLFNAQKRVTRLDEVKGLRLATLTKADAQVVQRLGAAPLSTSPTEVYEILQRHTADGVVIGWLGLIGFKLVEVTSFHLVVGLGSGGGFLLMNNEAYERLPAKAKRAIDRNSGYEASKELGASLDRIYAGSESAVRKIPGQTIDPFAPAEKDRYLKEIAQPLIDAWVKNVPNGGAIFAAYRAEAARVRQEN